MSQMSVNEHDLVKCLSDVLIQNSTDNQDAEVDEDLIVYMAGMLSELSINELMETVNYDNEEVKENIDDEDMSNPVFDAISPFLESVGCESSTIKATCEAVNNLAKSKNKNSTSSSHSYESGKRNSNDDTRKLKGAISMSSHLDQKNTDEEDANRFLWGTDSKLSAMTNHQKDMHKDTTSSKARRKQRQDLEKARKEYDAKMKMLKEQESKDTSEGSAVSIMVLPDYTCDNKREKDIQVRNVSLSLDNGRSLLDNAELKISYQRRYGLVGKNGVGKTTLLKAIASMSIEGFPKHHRVLHVRQEMHTSPSSKEISVLDAVLQADVERMSLLEKEKELLKRLEGFESQGDLNENNSNDNSMSSKRAKLHERMKNSTVDEENDSNQQFTQDLKELDETYARLAVIGGDGAESRASMILAGLQFTHSMQTNPVAALSGGWKMRVSLAAALFIEPDLLLLDEPTNHLDLEAVLWLESYLVQYKHTCIVVSHDRGFLNEVCTDIIEFKDKELNYYKGDYDTYVKTSEENVRNTMRVYQAYQGNFIEFLYKHIDLCFHFDHKINNDNVFIRSCPAFSFFKPDKRAHMMEFITKFRFNAKRAALVQSRIKAVEKMDLEAPPMIEIEQLWRFSVPNPEPLGRPIISVDDVSFDYSHHDNKNDENVVKKQEKDFLLQKVNFGIDLDSRIGILGANGAGKVSGDTYFELISSN